MNNTMTMILMALCLLSVPSFAEEGLQRVDTDWFSVDVPKTWPVEKEELGILAGSKKASYVRAIALPGFYFWKIDTLAVFFQSNNGSDTDSGWLRKVAEDEIAVSGEFAKRKIFEDDSMRSWWIAVQYHKTLYILVICKKISSFDEKTAHEIVKSFRIHEQFLAIAPQLATKRRTIEHPHFSTEVPATWKFAELWDISLICEKKYIREDNATIMVLSHRRREISNCGSLLPLLMYQETVKNYKVEDIHGRMGEWDNCDLANMQGRMVEWENNDESYRVWIIAARHTIGYNSTDYGIIIKAPTEMWEANPQFARDILKNFSAK